MSMQAWLQAALQQRHLHAHAPPEDVLHERHRVVVLAGTGLLIWLANLAPSSMELLGLKNLEIDPGGVNRGLAVLLGLYFAYYLGVWMTAYHDARRKWDGDHPIRRATAQLPDVRELQDVYPFAKVAAFNLVAAGRYWTARSYLFLRNTRFEFALSLLVVLAAAGLLLADASIDVRKLPVQSRMIKDSGVFSSALWRTEVSNGPYAEGALTIAILDSRKRNCSEKLPVCKKPSFLSVSAADATSWWDRLSGAIHALGQRMQLARPQERDERRYCELAWSVMHALAQCSRQWKPVVIEVRGFASDAEPEECRTAIAEQRARWVSDLLGDLHRANLASAVAETETKGLAAVGVTAPTAGTDRSILEDHNRVFNKEIPSHVDSERAARRTEIRVRGLGVCELGSQSAGILAREL